MKNYNDFKSFSKNQAYWERNQLVAALSKIYPSWLEKHPKKDKNWDKEWRTIVFIEIPTTYLANKYVQGGFMMYDIYQLSWHLHDDDVSDFDHLEMRKGNSWDGHTSEEKYQRLRNLTNKKKWWQFWL